jgi:beta-glucanase (GH16 family)
VPPGLTLDFFYKAMIPMKLLSSIFISLLTISAFSQKGNLIWSDDFEGKGLPDSATWTFELGSSGWGNNEVQNYTGFTENVRQENGLLVVEALKKNNEWTSARIISFDKVECQYGRIVFRAKLPAGSGTWPALWMLGHNINTAGWPDCGEIDVMEHVGKNHGVVHNSLHTLSSYGATVNTMTTRISGVDTEFHEYEANWTRDKIEFSIDGNLLYTYEPAEKNRSTWPFDQPFFIIINIAMGGNFGSDPQFESKGLKNGIDPALTLVRMEVDYVRIYSNESNTSKIILK